MDWSTSFALAEALCAGDGAAVVAVGEARYRCAAGRAYYAVFGTARALVETVDGNVLRPAEVHGELPLRLRDLSSEPASRQAGLTYREFDRAALALRQLRRYRNLGDYDAAPFSEQTAKQALVLAEYLLQFLSRVAAVLLPPPPAGAPDAS
ncbi:MAG: HEPN domain-containing protein [Fimbriimonadaceae bacterium]|nr:HEPN domain-containing protein [Fimbriimonadaceae bacterium]